MSRVFWNSKSPLSLKRVELFCWFLQVVICILLDTHWSYKNMLFWAGIVKHSLSGNQIVRCFNLKNLEHDMRYKVDLLLPLKLEKIFSYGLWPKRLFANQFAGLFTFDLFDLINLIPGGHCYIVVLISKAFFKYFARNHGFLKIWLAAYLL